MSASGFYALYMSVTWVFYAHYMLVTLVFLSIACCEMFIIDVCPFKDDRPKDVCLAVDRPSQIEMARQ